MREPRDAGGVNDPAATPVRWRAAADADLQDALERERMLVTQAAGGDAAAFEDIVKMHASLVLGLGRRVLGSRADAEDLLQDVFVRVHRALPSFRFDCRLKAWIARITVNAARNRLRDDSRAGLHGLRSLDAPLTSSERSDAASGSSTATLGDLLGDDAPSPERLAISLEARERIELALANLSEEFRVTLVLREIEGLSLDDIATALDISEGTVKSRLSRARAKLREELSDLVTARRAEG